MMIARLAIETAELAVTGNRNGDGGATKHPATKGIKS